MSWRDIKSDARRAVHENMHLPALYIEPGFPAKDITVRLHTKFLQLGDMKGTSFSFAEKEEVKPKIIFLVEEVPAPVRNAIVSIAPGEAYRIDHTLKPDGLTVTAEVLRLSETEAALLPIPQ